MPRRPLVPRDGQSQRTLRVGETVRRALSDILLRGDLADPELGRVPITVGEVRMSPDLRHATVHVMPLGGRMTEEVLAALGRSRAELRRRLAAAIDLRHAPDLRFVADATYDRIEDSRRLLGSAEVRRDVDAG